MARTCDLGTCQADAVAVARYLKPNQEACTKAACSKYHADAISDEMKALGYDLTWKAMPKTQPPDWIQ